MAAAGKPRAVRSGTLQHMKRAVVYAAFLLVSLCLEARAHDPNKTPLTWNREISRLFYERCASCHREGGSSFSLMTYREAQPWIVAIKEQVMTRRMPPWGAVKGFGSFQNDQGLTQEQTELIVDWIDGGARRGNNPNVLPKEPKFKKPSRYKVPKNSIKVSGDLKVDRALTLEGLWPEKVPEGQSIQILAELPDGTIEPLLWLYEYKESQRHEFLFRKALELPAGTVIRGVPPDATVLLIARKSKVAS
jgi:hypothetical protein